MEEFAGITLDDLCRVETTFQTNVCVYKLVKPDAEDAEDGKSTAELVRRSLCKYPETMYLNLHETHFSFIRDVRMYCNSYRCRKCGDSLWKDAWALCRHERTCTGVCIESIPVACTIRLHRCSRAVSAMMDILQAMSDAAYDKIKHSYEDVLEQLAEELTNWDEREETTRAANNKKKSRRTTNPYKKLKGQLYGWMRQLPVIGFNSGKYDLNTIKQFLIPYFLSTTSKTGEQEEQEQEEQDDKEEENEGIGSSNATTRSCVFCRIS